MRKAYKKVDGEWVEVEFMELKKGDLVKLQEDTGEWVEEGEEFLLTTDAYLNDSGIGTFQVDVEDDEDDDEGYAVVDDDTDDEDG